jgi:pyrimidine operon attenuation protein/uracil phosphoribosyltransferase
METLLDAAQISQFLNAMADDIAADPALLLNDPDGPRFALVGIRNRGELLAQRLAELLAARSSQRHIDAGALDITFYRDDLAYTRPNKGPARGIAIPQGTDMNFPIDDRPVILVDDVLETGRSVRAALEGIVAFGRPSIIRLAVLIDRGNREFPIAADFVGIHITQTDPDKKIRVRLKPTDTHDAVYLE